MMLITDDCINCTACAVECPRDAVLEPGKERDVNGIIFPSLSEDHYFIVTEICDECSQLNEIKCVAVCPMNAIEVN
ncbi:MAG: 4Fe-4S dicluster domain-containing protein [Melioribacteraceae bacterium]|jgi:Fe-S-cluster-containing dehydrogenase component|nr:MAG: 4Fe-4S dicluster domain-containing protein [Melioribacteraceae bacterium]